MESRRKRKGLKKMVDQKIRTMDGSSAGVGLLVLAVAAEARALVPAVQPAAHIVPPTARPRLDGKLCGSGGGARKYRHDGEVSGALELLTQVVDAVVC